MKGSILIEMGEKAGPPAVGGIGGGRGLGGFTRNLGQRPLSCVRAAFTLLEVMVAAAILAVTFTGFFLVYGQCVRMLDGQRQTSRAHELCLANLEFLRTCTWSQITNLVVTSGGSATSQLSSNLIESVSMTPSNNPVCSHLIVVSGDPLYLGIRNPMRDISISPNPVVSTTTVVTATVTVSYDSYMGGRFTNSLSTRITKSGLTAVSP